MSMSIGRPVSPTFTSTTQTQPKVAPLVSSAPVVDTATKTISTPESFSAARQSVVGKTTETVSPSQGGIQAKQGIDQADDGQLLEQSQTLMESPMIQQEFSDVSSSPSGGGSITPDMLVQAREKLKPISQHQVLNLEKGDTTVTESSRSIVLKDEGSAFAPERLSAKSTLEIVGHGSKDGSTIGGLKPKQLAQKLKQDGIKQLAVLDLKSCYSAGFKKELEGELEAAGITVGEIKTYEGNVAISRDTGKELQGDALATGIHDGTLGLSSEQIASVVRSSGATLAQVQELAQEIDKGIKTLAELKQNLLDDYNIEAEFSVGQVSAFDKLLAIKELNDSAIDEIINYQMELTGKCEVQEVILDRRILCHEFAFGDQLEAPESHEAVINRTKNQTIALCFEDGMVGHTARMDSDGDFIQAAQGMFSHQGDTYEATVIFKTDLDTLKDKYSGGVLVHSNSAPITKSDWTSHYTHTDDD